MDTRKTCYLFLDYDGTVYLNEKIVPQETKDALKTVQSAGHQVLLNTGRSRGNAPEVSGIRWDGELYGGADYTYRGERRVLGSLEPQEGEAWFRSAMERRAWIHVECDRANRWFAFNREEEPLTQAQKDAYLREYRELVAPQTLMKLSVGVRTVEGEPTAHIHVIDQKTYLELFPLGLDKGEILREFCGRYGIEREQCIAFGDSCNDLAAFEAAGESVAMKGSPEELEKAATYRAEGDSGVAEGIAHFFPELFS